LGKKSLEDERDRAFAAILLELGLSTRSSIEKARAARAKGDERSLGRILLANGWLDELGYLRAIDAQRAREALAEAPVSAPSPDRLDLEKRRRAARAAVQKGALVAEAAANAPFLRRLVGKLLGRVRVERIVGKGPMAFTLAGRIGDRPVRVKVLRPDMADNARALARFDRECAALAHIDHPSVVRILDHGIHGGEKAGSGTGPSLRWFATEMDEGETLAARLQRFRFLDPHEVVAIGQDAAHGLAAAHGVNVVHRDLRPETIFVSASGTVKIFDFGLARAAGEDSHLTIKGQILGAAEYAAPELAAGEPATSAADVYALGVTLHRALTGELPYSCRSVVRLMTLHASAPIPWANTVNGAVPRRLAALVRELLGKKPADRPTMNDVAFKLADPGVVDETGSEPEECFGCGAFVEERADATVPICPRCIAEVADAKRCGGCLNPVEGARSYAGRAYCAKCLARIEGGA
jgi:serine/threonine-protein kinase